MSTLIEATRSTGAVAADGGTKRRQKTVRSRTAMDVQPRRVQWLWHGLVPFGAITVLAGQAGLGKSLLTVKLAADLSAGRIGSEGAVLMLTAEDPVAEVVVPRLEVARAKRSVIHFGEIEADGFSVPIRFPEDTEYVAELVREHGARLIVIDPFRHILAEASTLGRTRASAARLRRLQVSPRRGIWQCSWSHT